MQDILAKIDIIFLYLFSFKIFLSFISNVFYYVIKIAVFYLGLTHF
jgi:hypothetical protein